MLRTVYHAMPRCPPSIRFSPAVQILKSPAAIWPSHVTLNWFPNGIVSQYDIRAVQIPIPQVPLTFDQPSPRQDARSGLVYIDTSTHDIGCWDPRLPPLATPPWNTAMP